MRKLFCFLALSAMFLVCGCSNDYNDAEIKSDISDLKSRVSILEQLCSQLNTDIASLKTIVSSLQKNDYITNVTPIQKGGEQIGYTITFEKSSPITIYNGTDGKDGITPIIGVKAYQDGKYYWTLNGEWLLDTSGNKILAQATNGKDGITPQLKIENDYWYISNDNGSTWVMLGKAKGEDGNEAGGDSIFKEVTQDENSVYFTLKDGTMLAVSKQKEFSISFSQPSDITVEPNKKYSIGYTINGADGNTIVKLIAKDGYQAKVNKISNASGTIEIITPSNIISSEILVLVNNGKDRTLLASINFVVDESTKVIFITNRSYTIGSEGGHLAIDLQTNVENYTVEIPASDQNWITFVNVSTRASLRKETVNLNISENNASSSRRSTITIKDLTGTVSETVLITQKAAGTITSSKTVHVTTPGTLDTYISSSEKNTIEDLTITGNLNTFDFDFLRTMKNLKNIDLSNLENTTLPSYCFYRDSSIQSVTMPSALTAIPEWAFYESTITSLTIPPMVKTIGKRAFGSCQSLRGDIIIPDSVDSIAYGAFAGCEYLRSKLHLGSGLRIIEDYAFAHFGFIGDLIIPDNVTKLGDQSFSFCSFTGKLVIGKGIKRIGHLTFYQCPDFTGPLTIGENVQEIGQKAFKNCFSVSGNLILPAKVETIDREAFVIEKYDEAEKKYKITKLNFSRVYSKSKTPPTLEQNVFSGGESLPFLGVPIGSKSNYQKSDQWKNFDIIEEFEF